MGKNRPRPVRLGGIESDVDEYLKASGESFSLLVKKSIAAYFRAGEPEAELSVEDLITQLKKMRGDLARVGGNLNQLALYFNTTGIVHNDALGKAHQELQSEFRNLTKFFRDVEKQLLKTKGPY